MHENFQYFFAAGVFLVGYLLGSVSFAVIVARRQGVDILKAGSGNPGATNVKRVCGRRLGNLVFALDVAKGLTATAWPNLLLLLPLPAGQANWDAPLLYAQFAGFVGAVLGHCFSVFLRFKGGKGVAVSVGGLCGTLPGCLVVAGSIWLLAYFLTRYVSIASLVGGFSLPVSAYFFWGWSDIRFWLCLLIMVLIVFTHRANIRRLLRGEEHRFGKKEEHPPEKGAVNSAEAKSDNPPPAA